MRNSTAFFAGVVTVFSATALGFGGAMMLTAATTSHSPTETTKLERSIASPAKASQPADPKTVTTANSSGITQGSNQSSAPTPASPSPPPPAQQAATTSPSAQTSSMQVQSGTPAQPAASGAEQSAASSQARSAANAYARANDEDVRKIVRKRERHWAHRHYRDQDATTAAQDAKSGGENDRSQSSISENQPAAQGQSQPPQIKTADQTPTTKAEDSDANKVKRKHDRRWTRTYSRDYGERGRDEDRAASFEVREMPREDGPQTLFGSPRWRPFFSDSDDED